MLLDELLNDTLKQKMFFGAMLAFQICPFKLNEITKEEIKDYNIIDVRDYDDYTDGHIPFAVHIPIDDFEKHIDMLEKDKINIIYCESDYCLRAAKACYLASEKGYKAKMLIGGYHIWKKLKFDTVKSSSEK